jgi:hypothetical protein
MNGASCLNSGGWRMPSLPRRSRRRRGGDAEARPLQGRSGIPLYGHPRWLPGTVRSGWCPGWTLVRHQPRPVARRARPWRVGRRRGRATAPPPTTAAVSTACSRRHCSPIWKPPGLDIGLMSRKLRGQMLARTNNAKESFTLLPGEEFYPGSSRPDHEPRYACGDRSSGEPLHVSSVRTRRHPLERGGGGQESGWCCSTGTMSAASGWPPHLYAMSAIMFNICANCLRMAARSTK